MTPSEPDSDAESSTAVRESTAPGGNGFEDEPDEEEAAASSPRTERTAAETTARTASSGSALLEEEEREEEEVGREGGEGGGRRGGESVGAGATSAAADAAASLSPSSFLSSAIISTSSKNGHLPLAEDTAANLARSSAATTPPGAAGPWSLSAFEAEAARSGSRPKARSLPECAAAMPTPPPKGPSLGALAALPLELAAAPTRASSAALAAA